MKPVKVKDDFFYIENFLTEFECNAIIKYLEWQVEMGYIKWNQISFYGSLAMGYWPNDDNLEAFGLDKNYFNVLKEKIKFTSESLLGKELSEISYHAQKWITGAFADYHSDNSDEHGNPTAFQRSKYAVFIYLNENFTGGALKFKNHDIDLQPKQGLIAIFAGGHGNEHMVTTVESGERYTVGSFWDSADSVYSDEEKKKWEVELKEVRSKQEKLYERWSEDKEKGIVPTLRVEEI
jgi:hypothetical protein